MTDWLTVEQAAEYAGFSTRTIRQRVHDGDLPAYDPARVAAAADRP